MSGDWHEHGERPKDSDAGDAKECNKKNDEINTTAATATARSRLECNRTWDCEEHEADWSMDGKQILMESLFRAEEV